MEAAQRLTQPVAATRGRSKIGFDSEFEDIFLQHYKRVFGVLIRLLGDRVGAEEVTSEVFWKLYNQPLAAPLWSNVGPWLHRTAVHAGIDAIRASARRKQYEHAAALEPQHCSMTGGPLSEILRAEDSHRVRAALAAMKPSQARILVLRVSGCSYQEIADALNVAPSGVGTLLNRAEQDFRKHYLKLLNKKEK